jgi:hypothetical protein
MASHASTWRPRGCGTSPAQHGPLVLHEYATSLSAAGHANRSRRLIKCAKDSGHYPMAS